MAALPRDGAPPVRRFLASLRPILSTAAFLLLLDSAVVQAFHVPTGSMEPTVLVGDRILVNRFLFGPRTPDHVPGTTIRLPSLRLPGLRDPEPGDIVVLDDPRDESTWLLKRCVAGPGQTLELRAKHLYVDGVPVEEPYVHPDGDPRVLPSGARDPHPLSRREMAETWGRTRWNRDNFGPVVVPAGQYFMMGDNRDRSSDSRYWGFVDREEILGKAVAIYWSGDPDVSWARPWERVRWERLAAGLT